MSILRRRMNPRQIVSEAGTFFITVLTLGRRNLFAPPSAAEMLVQVLRDYREDGKYRLHEYVVMPDHFHALITVAADYPVERAVQCIKREFASRAETELGLRPPVWQKGFSELWILDDETFKNQAAHVREDPVAARLSVRAEQYAYSSASLCFPLDPPPRHLKPIFLDELYRIYPGVR